MSDTGDETGLRRELSNTEDLEQSFQNLFNVQPGDGQTTQETLGTEGVAGETATTAISQEKTVKTYQKKGDHATTEGVLFEVKLAALVFLRLLRQVKGNEGFRFQMAGNVDKIGALDDLVFRFKYSSDENWRSFFVQQKFKRNAPLKFNSLDDRIKKSIFPFYKHHASWQTIKSKMDEVRNEGGTTDLYDGSFEDCEFIFYTNAKLNVQEFNIAGNSSVASATKESSSVVCAAGIVCNGEESSSDAVEKETNAEENSSVACAAGIVCNGEESSSGNDAVGKKIKAEKIPEVPDITLKVVEDCSAQGQGNTDYKDNKKYNVLKTNKGMEKSKGLFRLTDTPNGEDCCNPFLKSLMVFSGQLFEHEMDEEIKDEMRDCCKSDEVELIYPYYEKNFNQWSQHSNVILEHDSEILKEACDRFLVKNLSCHLEREFNLAVKFKNSNFSDITKAGNWPVLHVCDEDSERTLLNCSRIIQMLQKRSRFFLFLTLDTVLEQKETVMSAWVSRMDTTLVIVSWPPANSTDVFRGAYRDLCATLKKYFGKLTESRVSSKVYPVIIISSKTDPFTVILQEELRKQRKETSFNYYLECFDEDFKEKIREKKVISQDQIVSLSDVVETHRV